MINFPASTFTWKALPREPDPYYKYAGGFVGTLGQVYHVRFNIESKCEILDEASGHVAELFIGAPCRGEYTIATRNLFMIPTSEFRMAFSREQTLYTATRPSDEPEDAPVEKLSDKYQDHKIDLRRHRDPSELSDARQVVEATLANDMLNARSTYRDRERGLTVTVEYPVNLINVNEADDRWVRHQVAEPGQTQFSFVDDRAGEGEHYYIVRAETQRSPQFPKGPIIGYSSPFWLTIE